MANVSDRAKYLALYNIHCAHPIGIANVHTPAERRGGKPTLRSRFTGSYIQLHKDNSAGQDSAESGTYQASNFGCEFGSRRIRKACLGGRARTQISSKIVHAAM